MKKQTNRLVGQKRHAKELRRRNRSQQIAIIAKTWSQKQINAIVGHQPGIIAASAIHSATGSNNIKLITWTITSTNIPQSLQDNLITGLVLIQNNQSLHLSEMVLPAEALRNAPSQMNVATNLYLFLSADQLPQSIAEQLYQLGFVYGGIFPKSDSTELLLPPYWRFDLSRKQSND
jgi:hypothetical protein